MKQQEVFFTKDATGKEYPVYRDSKACQMFLCTDHEPKFTNAPVTVCGQTINPGEYSDLNGFFTEPLKYCGATEDFQAFFLGSRTSLFEKKFYYDLLIISPQRDDQILLALMPRSMCQILFNKQLNEWK